MSSYQGNSEMEQTHTKEILSSPYPEGLQHLLDQVALDVGEEFPITIRPERNARRGQHRLIQTSAYLYSHRALQLPSLRVGRNTDCNSRHCGLIPSNPPILNHECLDTIKGTTTCGKQLVLFNWKRQGMYLRLPELCITSQATP